MTTKIPPNTKLFRAAIVPMSVCIFVLAMFVFSGLVILDDGLDIDWMALGTGAAAAIPAAILWAWVLWYFFPAAFTVDGIYGHSFWGVRRFIGWSEIQEARTFRLLNLRYLRLYSNADRSVTWVALFQVRKIKFWEEIVKLSPSQNPILKHLPDIDKRAL